MADNNKQLQLTPSTAIEFFNVPWDINYNHVVKFDNIQAQNNYFSTPAKTVNESTFMTIEPMSLLRIDAVIDWILQSGYNYCRFRNFNVNVAEYRPDRWYYAFIKNARWASNNSTFIDIELDVYQTFLFDFTLFPSFVEREHIANDTIGANTVDENIATGYIKVYNSYQNSEADILGVLAIATSTKSDPRFAPSYHSGVVNGLTYFYFPPGDIRNFGEWVIQRNNEGTAEGIKAITMIPDAFVKYGNEPQDTNIGSVNWLYPWKYTDYCRISQGMSGNTSHKGRTAIDFAPTGVDAGSNIPLFAPTHGFLTTWGPWADNPANIGEASYGNYVTIQTTDGYTIIMAHMHEIFVQDGPISTGDNIGTMGNTGNSTGIHLHFEVKITSTGKQAQLSGLFGEAISYFWKSNTSPIPGDIMGVDSGSIVGGESGLYYTIVPTQEGVIKSYSVPKSLNNIDGYIPKNNKLFTFPYNYIMASNNQNGAKEYRYECMPSGDVFYFNFSCDVSSSPSLFVYPQSYNGCENNHDDGLRLTGYPLVATQFGAYENWLAQSGGSALLQSALAVGSVALGAYTGGASSAIIGSAGMSSALLNMANSTTSSQGISALNGLNAVRANTNASEINRSGAVGQGLLGAASNLIGFYGASKKPDLAQGNMTGCGLVSQRKMNVTFFAVGLRREYAIKIDKYFDRYGYATNDVKMPNVNSRPYWNYVKTQDVNLHVNAPAVYENVLKSIFNKGVTIWKNPNNIGNFSLNNH